MQFNITFEKVTPESAEYGENDSIGYIAQGLDLREAVRALGMPSQGFENSDSGPGFRWVTACTVNDGTREYFEKGITESRALHFPEGISDYSRARVARLIETGRYSY